jgi:beta-lactamase regulating signal transducer with metallopeptidase domain
MTVFALLLSGLVKPSMVLLGAAVLLRLLIRASAATRHCILASAMAVLLMLPAASVALPARGGEFVGWLATAFANQDRVNPMERAAVSRPLRVPQEGDAGNEQTPGTPWEQGAWAVWLIGFSLAAWRIAADQIAIRALVRAARPAPRIMGTAKVFISDRIDAPATVGVLRPIILLPTPAMEWQDARLTAALAHEAAHIRRRDMLTAMAAGLCCAIYWFNPFVWGARRRLALECEKACDDEALAAGVGALDYAAAVVASARDAAHGPSRQPILAMAGGGAIEERLIAILAEGRPRGRSSGRSFGLALSASLVLLLPLASLRPAQAHGVETPWIGPLDPAPDPSPSHKILVDPRTERLDLAYGRLVDEAARVSAVGPDAAAIVTLKQELDRQPRGIDDLVRERSIWALLRVRRGRLVEPLIEALQDDDWRVRAYASWGLGVTGSTRAVPPLVERLADTVWRVRANAAFSLSEIGGTRVEPALTAALRDPVWQVRLAAVEYFSGQPEPLRRERLTPLLQDPHRGTRLAVETALGVTDAG